MTNRPNGIVGGLGQNVISSVYLDYRRTLEGLWLCGDSIYPGGTAGSTALMVSRQI